MIRPMEEEYLGGERALDMLGSDNKYESDGSEPPVDRTRGCLYWVTEMMDRFMVRGSQSPMQWMLDLRMYGLKIHYNTTAVGHVGWKGGDELLYKNVQFTMAEFRAMVHGLVMKAQGLTEELLYCGKEFRGEKMPAVQWQCIHDDPSNQEAGFNFLHDQRTCMGVDGQKWLFDRIGRDSGIERTFIRPGSGLSVSKTGVEGWMRRVRQLQEKLLILMHITGEQHTSEAGMVLMGF
jgi:hypothetical protein